LKENKDAVGGADVYFNIICGNEELTTDVWDVNVGEKENINEDYEVDFYDGNIFGKKTLSIRIIAFDKDNSLLGDSPVKINGSQEFYSIEYDVTNLNQTNYTLIGNEGEVTLSIQIKRT
jgi:hypothetical protein